MFKKYINCFIIRINCSRYFSQRGSRLVEHFHASLYCAYNMGLNSLARRWEPSFYLPFLVPRASPSLGYPLLAGSLQSIFSLQHETRITQFPYTRSDVVLHHIRDTHSIPCYVTAKIIIGINILCVCVRVFS